MGDKMIVKGEVMNRLKMTKDEKTFCVKVRQLKKVCSISCYTEVTV